ncbi:hypothetical protein SAMN05421512_102350 [Stappia indica]|uniref:Uncharacterized protein n=1 Tax=Stappia indica TaxID=538381 RepID=A0A285RRX5_9HYPH|nr:hypothetical protein SAMN05421512_102350 [Stappia indica]
MPDRHLLTAKIRSYLQALSPRAVQTLLRGLEGARARGSDDPHLDLILDACLSTVRPDTGIVLDAEPRENWLQRLFFAPVEDMLVTEMLPSKERGRITRSSLPQIWTWIARDIAPDRVSVALQISRRLETEPDEVIEQAVSLRRNVLAPMEQALAEAHADDRAHQKISMLVGGERALRDVEDLVAAFREGAWLEALRESLPQRLTEWDFKPGSPSLTRIKAVTDRHGEERALIAAVVLSRVEAPESMLSLAAALAGSMSIRKIAESSYSVFAEMALSEVERYAGIACGECTNLKLSGAIDAYTRIVKVLDRQFDLMEKPAWQKRVADTRRQLSALVARELEAATGSIRRLLVVPKVAPGVEPEVDVVLLEEAHRGIMLVNKMRDAAENLAVNEITARTRHALDQSLDIKTRSLLASLAAAREEDRKAHLLAVDIAIDLCEAFYGKDYADQLRRSRKAALTPKPKQEARQAAS